MKDHFNKPEICPAYNFYKAEENIKYLLINQDQELNNIEIYELNNTLINLKEWFSEQYNEKAYKQNLSDLKKKIFLELKIMALSDILKTINCVNTEKISLFLNEKNLEKLKQNCKKYKLAFIDIKKDMISQLVRNIKGIKNDYNRTLNKFEDRNGNFNYMRTAINVLRNLGLQRDPMKITLVEWCEMIKLADELA
tara:strand:+ start:850 stop:1434 length:585 start_codon:yes stop_codon:yes gene_type:complete